MIAAVVVVVVSSKEEEEKNGEWEQATDGAFGW